MVAGVGSDGGEFVELVQVEEEAVAGHLVDGLVVAKGTVVFGDDARVRAQRDF